MPIVAGTRISRQQTLELAATLARDGSDHTARVLLDAITLARDFVALSVDDREALLSVLDHPRDELVDLRTALFNELNWRRGIARDRHPRSRSPYLRPTSRVERGSALHEHVGRVRGWMA
jgi:hypothetical protein